VLRQANHMLMLRDGTAVFVENWQQLEVAVTAPKRQAIRLAGAS
jgi:hypothetical protein